MFGSRRWPTAILLLSVFVGGGGPSAYAGAPLVSPGDQADSTWRHGEDLERVIIDLVTQETRKDLERGAPWFELDRLADYASDPKTLPRPINGRASDALWRFVPVVVSWGDLDVAIAVVELLRNPAANTNPSVIHQGTSTLAELLRANAKTPSSQEAAIRSVLAPLSAKRFFSATSYMALLTEAAKEERGEPLPGVFRSSIENMMTYPLNPDSAAGYLRMVTLNKGTWDNLERYEAVLAPLRELKNAERLNPRRFPTVNMDDYASRAKPVIIGIIDTGVAAMRYNMYENPGERVNDLDDDGNGLVDDVSGIVWDWDPAMRHQHTNLDQVEKLPPNLVAEYESYLLGGHDMKMGVDSPQAQAFSAHLASLSSIEEQKAFSENIGKVSSWMHGTHVAGLAVAGNRWAALASFRFSWADEGRIYFERGPSDQELRWERESFEEMVAWVNAHDIRVVNASVGFTVEYQEAQLSKERDVFQPELPAYGIRDAEGQLTDDLDLDAIRERAVQIQEFRREIWRQLFAGCPNTLFVLAAGNASHDIVEFEGVPNALAAELDNVLVVGAVDEQGEWATFSNFNKDLVKVYDFGDNVWSYSPTGRMFPASGTSMAAPNAANTAGKLLSLFPELTPVEVKELLIDSVRPIPAPFYGGIVDEPAAVRLAEKRRSKRAKESK